MLFRSKIPLTEEQAREILGPNRRNINILLPDTPRPLREVFVTGTTPAEWDLMVSGKVKEQAHYEGLNYVFSQS